MRLAIVPIERIVVTEHQPRYPERVLHYHRLLSDPDHAGHRLGPPVSLAHFTPDDDAEGGGTKSPEAGMYQLLDGHHRYLASVLAGRSDILALLIEEPGEPGYGAEAEGITIA